MPEVHGPEHEQEKNGKRSFINEKVVRQPLSRRQLAKRGLIMLCSAAVCGVVAAVMSRGMCPGDRSALCVSSMPRTTRT